MKKIGICIALAVVLVLGVSSASMATGIKLDMDSWCNDMWVSAEKLEGANVYGLHGYEYGCGYEDRLLDGSLRVTGGYAYFGLTGNYGPGSAGGDSGKQQMVNVIITMSTKTGTGYYSYFYISGGTLTGFGGGPTGFTMSYPQPPPPTAEAGELGPDTAAD